eukprot:CAMPEP_0203839806 /NCGR_PEP_ID=MMETSP0359-20131031/395_1 /ASSEMBLY_ACC=CAM_ASM_000338 /TAXON_ID=268821 /ORGANISM="Scrippsiella Hangoei, Strain SHTV-5" /LENGTH=53 /DNA_ID=CAMNT_0050753907 /DNA_START=228 /DNA_END=385 /DNA_ORIENTATION=-
MSDLAGEIDGPFQASIGQRPRCEASAFVAPFAHSVRPVDPRISQPWKLKPIGV